MNVTGTAEVLNTLAGAIQAGPQGILSGANLLIGSASGLVSSHVVEGFIKKIPPSLRPTVALIGSGLVTGGLVYAGGGGLPAAIGVGLSTAVGAKVTHLVSKYAPQLAWIKTVIEAYQNAQKGPQQPISATIPSSQASDGSKPAQGA